MNGTHPQHPNSHHLAERLVSGKKGGKRKPLRDICLISEKWGSDKVCESYLEFFRTTIVKGGSQLPNKAEAMALNILAGLVSEGVVREGGREACRKKNNWGQ